MLLAARHALSRWTIALEHRALGVYADCMQGKRDSLAGMDRDPLPMSSPILFHSSPPPSSPLQSEGEDGGDMSDDSTQPYAASKWWVCEPGSLRVSELFYAD